MLCVLLGARGTVPRTDPKICHAICGGSGADGQYHAADSGYPVYEFDPGYAKR